MRPKVYRLLTGIAEITEPVRETAPPELADFLFLYRSEGTWGVKKMEAGDFFYRLASACDHLGIERITARSMRKRYQTEVVLRGIAQNESRLFMKALTEHASISTTEKYYVREDVKNYLEATYGIEIGVPQVKGEVVDDNELELPKGEKQSDDLVEGGAGYCRNESCNVPGTLSCLMCDGFVTTPRCIPEMEEALENVQRRLRASAGNSHERDHLLAVKRMHLGYLAVMYSKGGRGRWEVRGALRSSKSGSAVRQPSYPRLRPWGSTAARCSRH